MTVLKRKDPIMSQCVSSCQICFLNFVFVSIFKVEITNKNQELYIYIYI